MAARIMDYSQSLDCFFVGLHRATWFESISVPSIPVCASPSFISALAIPVAFPSSRE
jgi:hypothetical protein